jgi:hypothetical protein
MSLLNCLMAGNRFLFSLGVRTHLLRDANHIIERRASHPLRLTSADKKSRGFPGAAALFVRLTGIYPDSAGRWAAPLPFRVACLPVGRHSQSCALLFISFLARTLHFLHPIRARPLPLFRPFRQPRRNRIALDVCPNPLKFSRIPHPMIERLVFPEFFPRSSEQHIRLPGRHSFQTDHNSLQRHMRCNQYMHMVRHHHKRMKVVESQRILPVLNCLRHKIRDLRFFQP